MKKTYAFLATLLLASGVAAQNPTAYFMEGTTFRSQFNPAFAPLRGYVNIPAIGGMNINVGGNIAVDNIPATGNWSRCSTKPFRPDRRFRDSRPTTCWASTPA